MKFIKSKNANVNYLAKIVELKSFHNHPNPEVTRLKCAIVDGYNIIVGIDYEPGKFVYFPSGCTINPQFLSYANLYRHTDKNVDSEKSGMFEDNGRVKSIKLKGTVSEGFLLPLNIMLDWINSAVMVSIPENEIEINTEFDTFEHNGKSFWINKKFVVENRISTGGPQRNRQNKLKKFNKVIDTQFRFHYDTTLIRRDPNAITPSDLISITSKWHGTSHISAYVLCKRPKTILEKLLGWLIPIDDTKYDYLYSSRSVIKNQYNESSSGGYYGCNVWAEADKILRPCLIKGMTIYAEIVGFTPDGKFIQKGYDYGCVPPNSGEEYTHEKHFKVRVYRITMTNIDGFVHEFSAREVQQYCLSRGLVPVEEFYYGYARDLYDNEIIEDENWNMNFIERLANDKSFYMEKNSPDCVNKVPHEGIVIKKEDMRSAAWKLKCFNFINGESKLLDAGESNIEDEN